MNRISSTSSEFAKFFVPVGILFFAILVLYDVKNDGFQILNTIVAVLILGIGFWTYFERIYKANEVWVDDETIVVKKWSEEEKIPVRDIEEVVCSRSMQGSPITLKMKNRKDIFFYPKGVFFPFQKPSIASELRNKIRSNQAAHTTPASAPR